MKAQTNDYTYLNNILEEKDYYAFETYFNIARNNGVIEGAYWVSSNNNSGGDEYLLFIDKMIKAIYNNIENYNNIKNIMYSFLKLLDKVYTITESNKINHLVMPSQ